MDLFKTRRRRLNIYGNSQVRIVGSRDGDCVSSDDPIVLCVLCIAIGGGPELWRCIEWISVVVLVDPCLALALRASRSSCFEIGENEMGGRGASGRKCLFVHDPVAEPLVSSLALSNRALAGLVENWYCKGF